MAGRGGEQTQQEQPHPSSWLKPKERAGLGEACLFPGCAYGENFTLVNNAISKYLMFL